MNKPGKRQRHQTTRITLTAVELDMLTRLLERIVAGEVPLCNYIAPIWRLPAASLYARLQLHPEMHKVTDP